MTLEEAKALFMEYKGSGFAMAREAWTDYIQYERLNISKQQKSEWRSDLIAEQYKKLDAYGKWVDFYYLLVSCDGGYTEENLMVVSAGLHKIKYENDEDRVTVAEEIAGSGRNIEKRDGLIFWAHKLGRADMVSEFYNTADNLINLVANNAENDSKLLERAGRAQARLQAVMDIVKSDTK